MFNRKERARARARAAARKNLCLLGSLFVLNFVGSYVTLKSAGDAKPPIAALFVVAAINSINIVLIAIVETRVKRENEGLSLFSFLGASGEKKSLRQIGADQKRKK